MKVRRKALLALLFLFFLGVEVWATHIRAGEIVAVRISQNSLRYRFTLIIYSDTGSGVQVGEGGTFNFGDGRVIEGGRQVLITEATFFDEELIEFDAESLVRKVYNLTGAKVTRNLNFRRISHRPTLFDSFNVSTLAERLERDLPELWLLEERIVLICFN